MGQLNLPQDIVDRILGIEKQIREISKRTGSPTSNNQTFTTPGTNIYVKPKGITAVFIVAISGGGSGGAGPSDVSATLNFSGGSGGGGGAYSSNIYPASAINPSENVIVGAGGVKGFGAPTNGGLGDSGNDGGLSSFGTIPILTAFKGQGGLAGTTTSKAGGVGGFGEQAGGQGAGSVAAGGGLFLNNTNLFSACGGGAGGGVNAGGTTAFNGSSGGASNQLGVTGSGTPGVVMTNGGNGTNVTLNSPVGGSGGGGGGGSVDAVRPAGNGGNAANYGGGGGGGGASAGLTPGGDSGAGGSGIVVVISW